MKTTPTKARISRVWIERKVDTTPDVSHLGEYARQPNSGFSIDRETNGDQGRNEYRFFNPDFEKYVERNGAGAISNDAEVRKYCEQDYRRTEALHRGEWCFIGIIAKAEAVSGNNVCQTLHSGGLWGIESDSDKEHFAEVENDQLAELRSELTSFGFGQRAIDYAFKRVERKEIK